MAIRAKQTRLLRFVFKDEFYPTNVSLEEEWGRREGGVKKRKEGMHRTSRVGQGLPRPFSLFPMLLFLLLPSASVNLLHLSWSSCRLITYCLTARGESTTPRHATPRHASPLALTTALVSSILFDRIVNRQCVITVIPDVMLRHRSTP